MVGKERRRVQRGTEKRQIAGFGQFKKRIAAQAVCRKAEEQGNILIRLIDIFFGYRFYKEYLKNEVDKSISKLITQNRIKNQI